MSTSGSSSSSSSKNKRGAAGGARTGEEQKDTKRQRCTVDEEDDDPRQQQQQRQKERMAELERRQKAIEEEIADDDRQIARLERARQARQRRREAVVAELARMKHAEKSAELRRRVRRSTARARIQECLGTIKEGSVPLDELLEQQFPYLIDNVDFWYGFLDEKYNIPLTAKVCQVLRRRTPQTVLNNKELVLQLCAYDPCIYRIIPEDWKLKSDMPIIEALLAISPFLLATIPGPIQMQNLSLVGKALSRIPLWCKEMQNLVGSLVDTRAWHNRDVVLGWVKGGGGFHNRIPWDFRDDQEIVYSAVGNKMPTLLNAPDFSDRLRADIGFMKQVVEKNPCALSRVAEDLIGDKDLAVAALSGADGVFAVRITQGRFVSAISGPEDYDSTYQFWYKVNATIRQDLRAHNAFVKLILGSIHFADSKPSALAVLDQGTETSLETKKLIAAYAGIPIGKDLEKLHRARRNLASAGIPWLD